MLKWFENVDGMGEEKWVEGGHRTTMEGNGGRGGQYGRKKRETKQKSQR